MSKYGDALGVWEIRIGGSELDIRPRMGDNRVFRSIMMNPKFKDDPAGRLDAFEDWFSGLLKREVPPRDKFEEEEQRAFIEFNSMALFEETLVKFRWTTRDELERSKKDSLGDLKKSIGGN